MVFRPAPGEVEWIEYCREHPNDPICLAGAPPAVGDRLDDFLGIRGEYLPHIEEEGLLDVEVASGRPSVRRRGDPSPQPNALGFESSVGLTPPPDPWPRPPEWPPWPVPRPDPFPFDGHPIPVPANRW
jgi:hypothetical protein